MQPYNECENRWLSKIKKKVKDHYDRNEALYKGLSIVMLMALFVLAMLTSIDSFFEIGN